MFSMTPEYASAQRDFSRGVTDWRMWGRLGWAEVRRRYRRTLIGPFWTSLSLAVFVLALGVVWATLWHQAVRTYLPFLCAGLITWTFISTTMIESCSMFISQEPLIKQMRFHYSMLASAAVWRNLIVFLHNLLVYVLVAAVCWPPVNLNTLLVVPGLLLASANLIWMAILIGLLTARFRDIQQLLTTLLQIAMFVTPIFWAPSQLSHHPMLVHFNVLYHLIDVVRSPLLGQTPSFESYWVVSLMAVLGWGLTFDIYSRFRRRVAYWL
jgi:ABC-type polysaccharide/polyol phosphate export permease